MLNALRRRHFRPVLGKSLAFIVVSCLLVVWLANTPGGLLGKADAIGYAVCHRIDGRSFHLGDRQLPLCSRCTGMYLGAMLALTYQLLTARRRAGMPHWSIWAVLGLFVIAFGVDGLNSYLHFFPGAPTLYEPTNLGRLLTGTGMGLVMALAIYPTFNQTAWQAPDMSPALPDFRSLVLVVLMALAIDGLVWIENPFLLYLFGLVSAFGVIVILSMVYGVFWIMILKSENRYQRLSQLLLPLWLGFGTSILQIGLFDLVRFFLTHTWGGFPLIG
jgi:uncharacterized membrane protein